MTWREGSTGVKEGGMYTRGSSRNLGDPVVSAMNPGKGKPGDQAPGPAACVLREGAKADVRR